MMNNDDLEAASKYTAFILLLFKSLRPAALLLRRRLQIRHEVRGGVDVAEAGRPLDRYCQLKRLK